MSIGIETFARVSVAWQLEGQVHPNLLLQIRRVHDSGIANWISNLVHYKKDLVPALVSLPVSASMAGNVLVIFLIQISGVCLGIVVLLAEHYKLIYQIVWFNLIGISKKFKLEAIRKLTYFSLIFRKRYS